MQDLSDEELYKPLTKKQQKELEKLKKNIPEYKPISWQGRQKICDDCPSNIQVGKTAFVCEECGCLLALKLRIPFSECPLGKW